MGWSTGSYIAEQIWDTIKDTLPEDKKDSIAIKIFNVFEEYDADDWSNEEDGLLYIWSKYNMDDKEFLEEWGHPKK